METSLCVLGTKYVKESMGIVLDSLTAVVEEDERYTRMRDKPEGHAQCKDGNH